MDTKGFIHNVLKLASGNLFVQLLGIAGAPIATRLFLPEAFGVAALFASVAGVITVVSCMRYELSILLPKEDGDAANLLAVSLSSAFVTSAITGTMIIVAGGFIATLLNAAELQRYLWLIPVVIFCGGSSLALNCWNTRTKHFGKIALAHGGASLTAQATKLTAGFAGYVGGGTLIGAAALGNVMSIILLGRSVLREHGRFFREQVRWRRMITGLRRYRDWPVFSTWSGLLNSVSQELPPWFLAFYFSPREVGFYALGRTALGITMGVVGGAVSQVFFQKTSEAWRCNNNLASVVRETTTRLFGLGILPILILTIAGKELFALVFGKQWMEAGVYAQILSLWFLFVFISSPLITLLAVLEKQRVGLLFNIVLFVARLASLIIGGEIGGVRITLILFSATGIAAFAWMGWWILNAVDVPLWSVLRVLLKQVLYCAPALALVGIAKWVFSANPFCIAMLGSFGAVLYYLALWKQDTVLRASLISLFRRVN
jgi:lipopolysaccharide exporter